MAQRINGIYSAVTLPLVYKTLMSSFGVHRAIQRYVREIVQPDSGMKVLDVGCGPAHMLAYLPPVNYIGIDLNERHIDYARKRYGNAGTFVVGNASEDLRQEEATFDLIIASGLLHHLSDDQCRSLFASLERLLVEGGRIVTLDGVWLPEQRMVVKFMNRMDSGLNIRTPENYLNLLAGRSFATDSHIYHDLARIPYDHFCMAARRVAN